MILTRSSAAAFLGAIVLQIVLTSSSQAAMVYYSSEAAFNAATTGNTTVDFTGLAPAAGFLQYIPPQLTVGGIDFSINTSESNGNLYVIDSLYSNNLFIGDPTILDSQFSTGANDNILITLPSAVTAIAFNFGSNIGLPVSFLFSTGDTTTVGTVPQTIQFLGAISSTPFTTIQLSQSLGGGLVLESVTTAVPEPSSIALAGLGSMGLAFAGYRRRKTSAI